MKKWIGLIGLLLFFSPVSFAQQDLKIMTYNIKAGTGAPIEEIGKYIASEEVDIVALQECDWKNKRAENSNPGNTDLTNVLAHETGMFPLYAKTIRFGGGYYGIGILSRYPIVRSERILLPNPTNDEQRVMLKADIELPDGQIVTFICTHLDYKSEEVQMKQVRFINRKVRNRNVTFIAGDFNGDPECEPAQQMRKKWVDLTNREFSFSTDKPEIKLDYIYSRKGHEVEMISTKVVNDNFMSDHFPVISVVKIID